MDLGHIETDKELQKLEKNLAKEYRQAVKELKQKTDAYFNKFAELDKKNRAKVKAGTMTQDEYVEWRKNKMLMGKNWEDMRDTLASDLTNVNRIAAGMINKSLPNAYAVNMNYGTYEVENGLRVDTGFTLYDRDTVKNLMQKDPQIIPQASVNIPKDEQWNRKNLTSAITQGILQGENISKISNRLIEVTNMSRNSAVRNARTYTTAAENKGRVDSYERAKDMGLPVKQQWMATLDGRTRTEHRHLDGQVAEVGEPFEADGYKIKYPGDPTAHPFMIYNCRCTLVAYFDKYGKDLERNTSKLDGMSYEEWKEEKETAKAGANSKQNNRSGVKQVHNKEEAKAALMEMFGNVEDSFMKNDEELIVRNTNQLLELNARFGALDDNNKGYITGTKSGRAVAWTASAYREDENRTSLSLVNAYYKNSGILLDVEERAQKSFFSMPTSKEYMDVVTITHEYGHILEIKISRQREDWDTINAKAKKDVNGIIITDNKVYRKAEEKAAKKIYTEIIDIAKQNNPEFDLFNNLSRYGQSNSFEAFAEMFANSQCGAPNELGIAMQQWLEREGF